MTNQQRAMISALLTVDELTPWEKKFIREIDNSGDEYQLSVRQAATLNHLMIMYSNETSKAEIQNGGSDRGIKN